MATNPEFLGPDGTYRQEFIFTTTRTNRFFEGRVAADTIDIQVSVRGSAFASDPDLVTFEGEQFLIPNPSAYPDGLPLLVGNNRIEVRSISTLGAVSAIASIEVRLFQEEDLGLVAESPTGLTVEQKNAVVDLVLEGLQVPYVQGYNYYASTAEGGGAVGYSQINASLVTSFLTEQVTEEIAVLEVDADIKTNLDGTQAADPLFLSYVGTQQDTGGTVLQTDFNERLEIEETVRQVRSKLEVSSIREIQQYTFVHDREADITSENPALPNGDFTALPNTDPLYYVATAIYYDPVTRLEVESSFSPEVVARPLSVTPGIGSFPGVSRDQIVDDVSLAIFRSQPQVAIQAGSVPRDTFIDPFSSEAERMRFILDFLHRAQSFSTLLPIDDPDLSGESVVVEDSEYKIALKAAFFLVTDDDVQAIIDQAFEKLANNFGVTRRDGRRATGEATFYTKRRPPASVPIEIGQPIIGGGVEFQTTASSEISLSTIASFFSPTTGRYAVRVAIQAVEAGEAGNIAIGQITGIENGPEGLSVTNEAATFGGTDEESNLDLATRAIGVLSSVDSGTTQGYRQVATDVPGVEEVRVVYAGNELMQRDFDPTTGLHRGGKVDVWVRGENMATVTDTFAFSFEIAQDVQFEVEGNPIDLVFRAVDPRLSSTNPIIEMLDYPTLGLEFRNASLGTVMSLTDVQILNYNTVQLSSSFNDPTAHSLSDVFFGSFRFRTSDKFVMTRQPVREIDALEGTVTGEVDDDVYQLFHPNSPMGLGRTTKAGDYLQVTDSEAALVIPSGDPVVVTDEEHVMLGEYIEYLENLGASQLTIHVWNEDKTVEYKGPFDPSGTTDYTIIDGTQTSPVGIKRTETSAITSGDTVQIDYEHDENFTVTYTFNVLVRTVQDALDKARHVTADVLAKDAVAVPVDLTATIVLLKGTDPLSTDSVIRTNLINFTESLQTGVAVRQSDVIAVIDDTEDVSYVVTPLSKMVRGEDAFVIRETLTTDQEADYELILDWSVASNSVYLLNDQLKAATTNGGGPENEFRGVFQNDLPLGLITVTPSAVGVPLNGEAGNAFIIGNDGLSINGYSDDITLLAQAPYTTPAENQIWAEERRVTLTSNRILVTLDGGVLWVAGEQQVLVGEIASFLDNEGVFSPTIGVWNTTRTVKYVKDTDYAINSGALGVPTGIRRITAGAILSGQTVLVDYEYHAPVKLPSDFEYAATYIVGEDSGVKNIEPGEVEFVELGILDFTFDEDSQ